MHTNDCSDPRPRRRPSASHCRWARPTRTKRLPPAQPFHMVAERRPLEPDELAYCSTNAQRQSTPPPPSTHDGCPLGRTSLPHPRRGDNDIGPSIQKPQTSRQHVLSVVEQAIVSTMAAEAQAQCNLQDIANMPSKVVASAQELRQRSDRLGVEVAGMQAQTQSLE